MKKITQIVLWLVLCFILHEKVDIKKYNKEEKNEYGCRNF